MEITHNDAKTEIHITEIPSKQECDIIEEEVKETHNFYMNVGGDK